MWTFLAGFLLGGITLFFVTTNLMVGLNKKGISILERNRIAKLRFPIALMRREIFYRALSEFGGEVFISSMEESASAMAMEILDADTAELREIENEMDFYSIKSSELDIYHNHDLVDFSLHNTGLSGEDLTEKYIWLSRVAALAARKSHCSAVERIKIKDRRKTVESILTIRRDTKH
jgi:hypothetical protein